MNVLCLPIPRDIHFTTELPPTPPHYKQIEPTYRKDDITKHNITSLCFLNHNWDYSSIHCIKNGRRELGNDTDDDDEENYYAADKT
jgi:hypothetical protein